MKRRAWMRWHLGLAMACSWLLIAQGARALWASDWEMVTVCALGLVSPAHWCIWLQDRWAIEMGEMADRMSEGEVARVAERQDERVG